MHCILVISNDDHLTQNLQHAAEQRGDFELTVAGDIDRALQALSTREWSAVLVGAAAAGLPANKRQRLLSADGRTRPVFAVGPVAFDELDAQAHLGDGSDARQVLTRIDRCLCRPAASLDDRADSEAYFVGDTQGQPYYDQRGLDRQTSQAEAGGTTAYDADAPRVLYVGEDDGFREQLEQIAEAGRAEAVIFRRPRQVSLRAGASPIDLAVLSVDAGLRATRRLVRSLRRRQPEAPFEVVLLSRAEDGLSEGLGRIIGADEVLEQPTSLLRLVERAGDRSRGSYADMLVVCDQIQRAELFESALAREPVDMTVVSRVERMEATFAACSPDIVLVDGATSSVDAAALVDRLRAADPFATAHYLAILDAQSVGRIDVREVFDGVVVEPVFPADIRQNIRLHLPQTSRGLTELERDLLTDVNSTLALGDDLQDLLDEAVGSGESVALTGVDVDDLGVTNSRYGDAVGDSVLRSLADALHLAVGDREAIYRTGADEFFILQRANADSWPAIREQIDRALHVFRQQTFRSIDGRGTYATASAGCVLIPPVRARAEECLQKCWRVLERAAATRQDRLLVAQIDPDVLGRPEPSRDRREPRR